LTSSFFMNQFLPSPEYPIRAFEIFKKICGNIRSSRCTTSVVADSGGKFTTGVIDTSGKTSGKFDTGDKFDTGSKFAVSIIDSGGKFTKMGTNIF
jgi:hypothetical protein